MGQLSAPIAVPTTEIGSATLGAGAWWRALTREPTPELRWPASIGVYDRMSTQETQIVSVLRAVTLPILRTQWRLDPTGCRDQVVAHCSADLGLPITGVEDSAPPRRLRGRFSWTEHLRLACLDLTFGHMFFEQRATIHPITGRAHLHKLAPRFPETIRKINVADDGGLESIEQHGVAEPIPVNRLVGYVHDRRADWTGRSLLRPAYKYWILKDQLLRTQAQTIERNGMGIPDFEDAPDNPYKAEGTALVASVRGGSEAGIYRPNGSKFTLAGVQGHLPNALPVIRYYDEQLGRMVLAHALNLGTQTGSWALGQTFMDFFVYSLQAEAEAKQAVAQAHIVEDLVDWNFGPDEPAPRIVPDPIGEQSPATAAAIKLLVDAGVLSKDPELEQALRQRFGLPPRGTDPRDDPAPPADDPEDTP